MIVGSVLLVIVAGVLLGLGLIRLDEPLLYSSIGVSALAALTLVVGVRRLAAVRAGRGAITVRPVVTAAGARPRPVGRVAPRPVGRATVSPPVDRAPVDLDALASEIAASAPQASLVEYSASAPQASPAEYSASAPQASPAEYSASAPQASPAEYSASAPQASPEGDPVVPADEPSPESVPEADLARIARLNAEVVVVDGRPRFHLAGCLHLLGLDSELVTVGEAVELNFTPCGLCRPVAALRLLTGVDDDAGPPSA